MTVGMVVMENMLLFSMITALKHFILIIQKIWWWKVRGLAAAKPLTFHHQIFCIMRIKCLSAVIMLNNNIFSITTIPTVIFSNYHRPSGGGINRRAISIG